MDNQIITESFSLSQCFCYPNIVSQALQGDVTKLQRKLDSLNETGTYMISKASPAYADKLKNELDELNGRWDELVRVSLRVKDNLVAALEKYQKLSHDMKEISHWIMQVERSIVDDEGEITSGGISKEKMDHYKVGIRVQEELDAWVRDHVTRFLCIKENVLSPEREYIRYISFSKLVILCVIWFYQLS